MIKIEHNLGTVIDTVQQAVILGGVLTPLEDNHNDNHNDNVNQNDNQNHNVNDDHNKLMATSEMLIDAIYTTKATEEDKRTIENFLRIVCAKHKRTMTAQIKKYLRMKQKDGLLLLPLSLEDEWEIVRQFGYDRSLKAYKNNAG